MEEKFRERLESVKDEFARELVESTQEVEEKYKRLLGRIPVSKKNSKRYPSSTPYTPTKSMQKRRGSSAQETLPFNFDEISETQIDQFVAEKEELLQEAETQHKFKIKAMENQMR